MKKWIKKGIVLALSSLAVIPVFAFADGLFTAPAGDLSIKLIDDIFGNGTTGGPLSTFLQMANSIFLLGVGVLGSYTLIMGTIKTAADGEALGKSWSSYSVPLNFAIFSALIIPMPSGLNGVEYMALQGIKMGAGLASNTWKAYVNNFTKDTIINVSNVNVRNLSSQTLKSLVCVEASKSIEAAAPGWNNHPAGSYSGTNIITYASYGSKDGCGSVDFGATKEDPAFNSKSFVPTTPAATIILNAHRKAYADLVSDLSPLAKQLAASQAGDLGVLKAAGLKYQSTISKSVLEYGKNGGQTDSNTASMSSDAMSKSGWILAPAALLPMINLQQQASAAAGRVPVSVEPDINDMPTTSSASIKDALIFTAAQINADEATHALGISQVQPGADGNLTIIDKFFAEHLIGIDLENLDTNQSPLLFFSSLGDRFAGMGVMTAGGVGALSLASGLPGKFGTIPQALLTGLAPLLSGIIVLCFTLGFTLLYLVPAGPLLIFFGGVTSWIFECIVAIFGVSMLACLASSDKNGVLESQKHGLILLIKCMAAPFFMIIGLVAGMIVSDILFKELINPMFLYLMKGTTYGLKSFMGNIFGGLIYCFISIAMLKKSFDFIYHLPDHIFEIVGGSSSPMIGSGAQGAAQALQSGTMAVSQNIGSVAGGVNSGLGAISKGQANSRDAKAEAKKKAAGENTGESAGGNRVAPPDPVGDMRKDQTESPNK